ncbi:MAG: DUF1579 domain-containing protein [Vicinamibacterales bacterium]
MTVFRSVRLAAMLVLLGAPVAAQTPAQQMPPMPKAGPDHEVFKMDVGTWDAVVEFIPGPGAPPMTSKGVEVNTLGCSGMCLITDFKGEAMGSPFAGHGVMTWDPAKKKYMGSWTDSMSTGLMIGESTYDPAAKKWSGTMEGPDMTGAVTKMRTVVDMQGASRVMTSFGPGPDGKEMQMMKITYTRRK